MNETEKDGLDPASKFVAKSHMRLAVYASKRFSIGFAPKVQVSVGSFS